MGPYRVPELKTAGYHQESSIQLPIVDANSIKVKFNLIQNDESIDVMRSSDASVVPSENGNIRALAKAKHTKLLKSYRARSADSSLVPSDLPTQFPNMDNIRLPKMVTPLAKHKSCTNLSILHTSSPKGSVAESFRVLPFNKLAVNRRKALTFQSQHMQQRRRIFVPADAKEFFASMQTSNEAALNQKNP